MKNSRDIERAAKHRDLFEKMLAKVDHKKDSKGRNKEAADMMDKKIGPQWRDESEFEGIAFVSIEGPDLEAAEHEQKHFDDRFNDALDTEGLQRAPEKEIDKEDAVDSMMSRLRKILLKVL